MTKLLSGQICDGQQVILSENGQCDYNPWIMVFEDNFDGNTLDLSKWTIPYQGMLRDFNFSNSKQWLANTGTTPFIPYENNIQVSNGTLKLIAKQENVIGTYVTDWSTTPPTSQTESFQFTSAEIASKYKFGYGKFEIRCKIPKGKGFWPAFWTYGENDNHINNEIDVFEFWNERDIFNNYDPSKLSKIHNMTVHYDGQMCLTDYNGPDYSQNFHTFTVIWDNYKIEWYVDGNLKRRSTRFYTILGQQVGCNGINAFHQYIMDVVFPRDPMQIIAGLGIQNGMDDYGNNNAPDGSTPFPSALEIDYIRYYKQMPCEGNVEITDLASLNLSSEIYNVIVGEYIHIDGDITIESEQQLEIIAKDEITLGSGFTAEAGSNFVARIDEGICTGVNQIAGEGSNDYLNKYQSERTNPTNSFNTSSVVERTGNNVKISPNPSKGRIAIEFTSDLIHDYEIYLTDIQGKILYSQSALESQKIEIDITRYNSGVYFLNVINTKNMNAYSNKIIKE